MSNKDLIKKISASPDISIQAAIQVLNEGHKRIVLFTDGAGKLIGVLSDSDVRRALLAGKPLDSSVSSIIKHKPIVAQEGMSNEEILQLMVESHCFEVPVIDSSGVVIDLKVIQDILTNRPSVNPSTALIMAGGQGVRLLPLTEKIPKPLVEIGGRPILFRLIDSLLTYGIRRIFIAINYKGEMIKDAILREKNFRDFVEFIEEEQPLGTAGALALLPESLTGPIVLTNADLLTKVDLSSMIRFHRTEGNKITVGLREESFQLPFGIARLDGHQLLGIEEKPTHKYYVSAGMYVLDPIVLQHIPKNSRLDMPDLINMVCRLKERVGSFPIFEYWKDIGESLSLAQAEADFYDISGMPPLKKDN